MIILKILIYCHIVGVVVESQTVCVCIDESRINRLHVRVCLCDIIYNM